MNESNILDILDIFEIQSIMQLIEKLSFEEHSFIIGENESFSSNDSNVKDLLSTFDHLNDFKEYSTIFKSILNNDDFKDLSLEEQIIVMNEEFLFNKMDIRIGHFKIDDYILIIVLENEKLNALENIIDIVN